MKASLIAKLKTFLDNKKTKLDLKDENIVEFCFENNQYKCKVKCSSCDTVTAGIFNKHWAVSNIEKHFKLHAVASAVETVNTVNKTISDSNSTQSSTDSLSNHTLGPSQILKTPEDGSQLTARTMCNIIRQPTLNHLFIK